MEYSNKDEYNISYSQYKKMIECPKKWYLRYVKGIKKEEPSVNLIFGRAMHEAIQNWLKIVYNKTKKEALSKDFIKKFEDKFYEVLENDVKKFDNNSFATKEDLKETVGFGHNIVKDFPDKWFDYFGVRGYELYGIEERIKTSIKNKNNLNFLGFIDIVLHDKNNDKYYIIDLKTTYAGWGKKKLKRDRKQLLLYKKYFCKQHDISLDKVIPMYIFLRKKMFGKENIPYKVSHVSKKIPSHKRTLKKEVNKFYDKLKEYYEFIENNNKVKFIKDREFNATPSENACKYCDYAQTEYCKVDE